MYTVANLSIFSGSIKEVVHRIGMWVVEKKHTYICVTGAHGIVEAQRYSSVMTAHREAGMVVPDGMPLVWVGKALGHKGTQRIYGPDLMMEICKEAQAQGWRVFLYGTTKETLGKLKNNLLRLYPKLNVSGVYAPPFGALTQKEQHAVIKHINETHAQIVFVGLSTPNQELWMQSITSRLHANVLIGVGAAFDFIADTKKQAPRWMQRSGLEWAYRVACEPKRLIGRYASIGIYLVLCAAKALYKRISANNVGKRIIWSSGVMFLTIGLFCLIEFGARVVTDQGWVPYFHPINIQSLVRPSQKKEDWRLTHMMKDEQFVSDRHLFWKPKKNSWRFNADGYIGSVGLTEVYVANKAKGCIVFALGDSNTQGIERNSWPEELDKLLQAKGTQNRALNAGVAGYTSMQGYQKFKEEIDRIEPAIIFISFGWNDVAPSMGVPDSEFKAYYSPLSELLSRLRLFLIFKNWKTVDPLNSPYTPRVSLKQYEENVEAMILESKRRGIKAVLLTRPYNSAHVENWRTLEPNEGGWRMQVPLYNDIVRQLAKTHMVPLLDLQKMTNDTPERFIDDSHFTAAEHLNVALEAQELIRKEALCGVGHDI